MLQTDQRFPSLNSQRGGVASNADGSVDIYFGPEAHAGKEKNWIQTVPGKAYFLLLRLYGPLDPWFDKTWRPGKIERLDWHSECLMRRDQHEKIHHDEFRNTNKGK